MTKHDSTDGVGVDDHQTIPPSDAAARMNDANDGGDAEHGFWSALGRL